MNTIDTILEQFSNTGKLTRVSSLESSSKLNNAFKNKTILISGAAGSIGSELARNFSKLKYKQLILLDIAESALYDLQQDLISDSISNFETVICDIRNLERLDSIFSTFKPDFVFHAAAYKHVPLMEHNPHEALSVNVLGTYNMSQLSIDHKVNKFILISSDKAVNPESIMGATKRIAELYINYVRNSKAKNTSFTTIRFGNVLGSNGSVLLLFKKQIEKGGPVTLTHETIDRYFLPLQETVNLILEASAINKGSQTYILDMGQPIKIMDIAKKMIQSAGLQYPKDIDIKIIGLRPGEKLKEELHFDYETPVPTSHNKIQLLEFKNEISEEIKNQIIELCNIPPNCDKKSIVSKIKKLVPEYIPSNF